MTLLATYTLSECAGLLAAVLSIGVMAIIALYRS